MSPRTFSRLAWGTLYFNLAVIVWGAFVRASGSGAGCGSHWPLCNGEIIPHTGLLKTAIEFVHRISSGVCLGLSVAIAAVGVRNYPKGNAVRKASCAVLSFTLSEALIGAALVLLRYVDRDQSIGRAVSICLHLANTFLLLASLALTAEWSTRDAGTSAALTRRGTAAPRLRKIALFAAVATVGLGITGALTALGDTLFHSATLTEGIARDWVPASHFLMKLRVIHPAFALATGTLLFYFADLALDAAPHPRIARLAAALKALIGIQWGVGLVNLLLMAPVFLQLIHLFVAESLWVVLVLTISGTLQLPDAFEGDSPC